MKIFSNLRLKKGIAIEMAIFTMVLIVALSIILVTTATISHSTSNRALDKLNNRIELDGLGNSFVSACVSEQDLAEWKSNLASPFDTYDVTTEKTSTLASLFVKDLDGKDILCIKLELTSCKILQWTYS